LEQSEQRLAALCALARFVRLGHEKGFCHDDCSAHHVFVADVPAADIASAPMFFIDVDNGRLESRSSEWLRVKNCFQLFRSLPDGSLTRREKAEFLHVYFDRVLSDAEIEDYLLKVDLWAEWKKQRKRLLKLIRAKKK